MDETMNEDRRIDDERIDVISRTVEKIFNILKGENGNPGICEDVRSNTKEIKYLKGKPTKARSWVIFVLLGVNTLVAVLALIAKSNA